MKDQASSLRELKRQLDKNIQATPENLEEFLGTVIRPSPFTAIALILPDQIQFDFPPIKTWIQGLMQHSPRAIFWDQAGLLESIPKTQIKLRFPTPVRIESGLTPVTILPQQNFLTQETESSTGEKITFLKHIMRSLKNSSEVWISIKASELKKYSAILHSTDLACVMVPQHSDSILRVYETVKSAHLSGYFSPIGLLDFVHDSASADELSSARIKIVAKQFLALDLVAAGMVLSNSTYLPPAKDANLRSRILSLESSARDFLYCLGESFLYQIPGLI